MYGKKILLTACVSMFLIVLMFPAMTASTSTDTVGVKAGDWAGYGDISFEYAANWTGYEQPPLELNISWTNMEVLDVSDSNVTVQSTTIYTNGTEQTDEMSGNIATGEGNLSVSIIPSNLGAGDEIPANITWYTEEPLKVVINGTVTRSYAGANREVNYVKITYPIIYDDEQLGTLNMSLYWDKKTGIMCEEVMSYAMSYTLPNSTHWYMNMSMLWRITATNMWPAVFTVQDGHEFNVSIVSNSTISNLIFNESLKQISFNVTGPTGKAGYCNVAIPKDLLRGKFSLYKDGSLLVKDVNYTQTSNGTHYTFYITYNHSTHKIEIKGTEALSAEVAFWMQWWFWTIIAIVIVALAGTVYFLRKRKSPTPAAPTSPT